ncbi:MAG TPA: VWA domain-containing protein [Bryobacteraceae bacterium]|nr:VWA domain-containing protein [Bryobacteraceae bacterium]
MLPRLFVVLHLAAAVAPGQQTPMVGPRQDLVFRAGLALVRVDAQVTQGERLVSGLTREDFVIFDNGKPQPVIHFRREEDPIDLILAIDTSGSMRGAIQKVNAVAHHALSQLRKEDRVAVSQFTFRTRTVQPLTQNFSLVEDAIEAICGKPFRGGTNIHGALSHAAGYLMEQPRNIRRRAILLITDGKSPTFTSKRKVLERIWEADAVLDALLVKPVGRQFTLFQRSVNVSKLVEETGGDLVNAENIGASFERIVERIRRRYSLHYALPPGREGDRHTVRVELTDSTAKALPGARVKARKGYVWNAVPSDSSAGISSLRSSPTEP